MHAPELQELLLVETNEALRRHFDGVNYRRGRLLWLVLALISLVSLLSAAGQGPQLTLIASVVSLAGLLALVPMRTSDRFRRNFATILFALFALESLLWILLASEEELGILYSVMVVSLFLLLLRLRTMEQLTLAAVATGAMALRWAASPSSSEGEPPGSIGGLVAVGIVTFLAAAIGASITTRKRIEFTTALRLAASRERERLRMRDELHDARAIQLAMLPKESPELAGLDIAGVCVPATEVGGDYYGYFPSAGGALSVAVGDVAGHGVASGLVLAGVRAGLLLLADEISEAPATVLGRLNTIVGAQSGQRLLMTLGLAAFDRPRGRAFWVSAGHPPPLRWVAETRTIDVPPTAHPPLGTRLPVRLETVERSFREGDVWLLVSDGAIEARDSHGREFGEGELERAFAKLAASGAGASEILDGMLAEHTRFRGGRPQEDDLTLVVVRAADAS